MLAGYVGVRDEAGTLRRTNRIWPGRMATPDDRADAFHF